MIPDITETEIPRCARNRLRNLLISSSYSQWDCFATLAMTAPATFYETI